MRTKLITIALVTTGILFFSINSIAGNHNKPPKQPDLPGCVASGQTPSKCWDQQGYNNIPIANSKSSATGVGVGVGIGQGGNATGGSASAGTVGNVGGIGNSVRNLSPEANASVNNTNKVDVSSANVNVNDNTNKNTNLSNNDNRNTNVMGQHQGQSQGQHQTSVSGAYSGGNVQSNDGNNTEVSVTDNSVIHHEAQKRNPVASAIAAPLTSSNDTCMGSSSGAVQGVTIGASFGTTWTDDNCVMLKNARELYNMGLPDVAIARMCQDKKNRQAFEDAGYHCPTGTRKINDVSIPTDMRSSTDDTGWDQMQFYGG